MKKFKSFFPYFIKYKREIAIGIIALLVTDLAQLVIPWLLKVVIDLLPQKPDEAVLLKYAGLLFLAAVVQGVARFGWRKFLFGPSRKIEFDILNQLFAHLQTLDKTFFQKQKIGDLISRATNDLRAVKDFMGLGLLILVDSTVVITACVTLMIYIHPRLSLYALLPLPLLSIFFFKFMRMISHRHKAIQEHLATITSMVQENLAGIRVLHAFAQEEIQKKKFDGLNEEYIEKNMRLTRLFGIFTPSLIFTIGIAALITLWIGGKAVIAGEMTLGSFVAFNGYLLMLSWPMMGIGYVINLTQKGLIAMGRIDEIFSARSALALPDSPELKEPSEIDFNGEIEFRDLSFTYPESDKPCLENINLKIKNGQTVAIIGMIGSGKSSLIQLLPRVYDAGKENLFIDGKPVSGILPRILRDRIGFVDQEPFLFSMSIRENILLGRADATEDEILDIVKCVNLTPDLERFPKGLDTIVGERGVSLSGGQKQRIALARALMKSPDILILDDAFSSLDVETEEIVLKNITEVIQGMTTIIVTHRLSITPQVDKIIVFDRGKIVESGIHSDLLKKEGHYKKLFKTQALAREMEISLQ